ncbi:hypothetical protein GCM10017710_27200 [Arthrobacter ramosus]
MPGLLTRYQAGLGSVPWGSVSMSEINESLERARAAVRFALSHPPSRLFAVYTQEDEARPTERFAGLLRLYPTLEPLLPREGKEVVCSREGLERLDEAIRNRSYPAGDVDDFSRDVALYYADTVLAAFPGAFWIVEPGRLPRVQVPGGHYIDMFQIAADRIHAAEPFLCKTYDRVIQMPEAGGGSAKNPAPGSGT